jgi:hypothetical protein
MSTTTAAQPLDYTRLFRRGVPEPTPRFTGFPKYNFVGGHNDPTHIPVEALAEAAAAALRREGAGLALYNLGHGPLGHEGLRDLVTDKLKRHRGAACTRDDVLITSGSLQGLDLVNDLLLQPGDTVLMEELSYGGAISRVKKRGRGWDAHGRALRRAGGAEGARHDTEVHLHYPDHSEPDRLHPAAGAATAAAGAGPRARRAGVRG